ncbi:DUF302 domain-containing protein [Amycolatopsis circi]|uniref:DUF302 domain-containing protein n=1 Tax=Amycolatopsis circi TaxID=871959 RepID=UPI001FCA1046|nr:DUF302 domain-containing protein [Amycolatopsis circi]
MITTASAWPVRETIDRLEAAVAEAGLLVFARIDHAANAVNAGMALRPTELLIFGHPRGGTPLMQDRQTSGLDLPMKALAWQDSSGRTWLTRDDAEWLASRHDLGAESAAAVEAISAGMARLVGAVVAREADPNSPQ